MRIEWITDSRGRSHAVHVDDETAPVVVDTTSGGTVTVCAGAPLPERALNTQEEPKAAPAKPKAPKAKKAPAYKGDKSTPYGKIMASKAWAGAQYMGVQEVTVAGGPGSASWEVVHDPSEGTYTNKQTAEKPKVHALAHVIVHPSGARACIKVA